MRFKHLEPVLPGEKPQLQANDQVCLDVAHRGLGTASCGPDVLPQYRIAAGRHEFAYRVSLRLQV